MSKRVNKRVQRVGANERTRRNIQTRQRRQEFKERIQHGLRLGVKILIVCAVLGGVGAGAWAAIQGMQDNGLLVLKSVEIRGNRKVESEAIMDQMPYELGTVFTEIETENVEKALMSLQWISDVVVKKSYPDKLIVKIRESVPVAVYWSNGEWRLVDDRGRILPSEVSALSLYPVVSDVSAKQLPSIAEMLRHIKEKDPVFYERISQMTMTDNESDVEVFLRDQKVNLLLNTNLFRYETLRNFHILLNGYRDQLASANQIDLRFPGFAFIR